MSRRAVITGLGVAAPTGLGPDAHWKAVLDAENRVGPISLFDPSGYPTTLAGEVPNFDPTDVMDAKVVVQTDRWTWLGFAAAAQALEHAALTPADHDPYSMAVALASSSGGNLFGQRELQRLWRGPERIVGTYQSIAWFYAASVGQLSIRYGIKGPSMVLAAEGAGGLDTIGHAVRLIERGVSAVLAGGTECPLSPYALACQQRSGWLSTGTDPGSAYLPFDVRAAGYVPAEGGAVLLVEERETALRRNPSAVLAEVAGWASTHDGAAARRGGGGSVRQYARAMRLALARAGLAPDQVDVVFLDALALPGYDRTEADALHDVFGAGGPAAVVTQKPLTGRLYQGGGVLDAVTAVLAMREGLLPPSVVPGEPAPGCGLPFVTVQRPGDVRVAMILSRGFDGFNSALVLRRHGETEPIGAPAADRQGAA